MLELFQRRLQLMDLVVPQNQAPDDPVVSVFSVDQYRLLDLRDCLGMLVPLEESERPVPVAAMITQPTRLLKILLNVFLALMWIVLNVVRNLDFGEVGLGLLTNS